MKITKDLYDEALNGLVKATHWELDFDHHARILKNELGAYDTDDLYKALKDIESEQRFWWPTFQKKLNFHKGERLTLESMQRLRAEGRESEAFFKGAKTEDAKCMNMVDGKARCSTCDHTKKHGIGRACDYFAKASLRAVNRALTGESVDGRWLTKDEMFAEHQEQFPDLTLDFG
jgi:hypothetical protein